LNRTRANEWNVVKLFVEPIPVDVTTLRTTPTRAMMANPLSTIVRVNGGVLRIFFSWRRPHRRVIPNRWLSASRDVGPRSMKTRRRAARQRGDPPPRAQENVRGKAQPETAATAEMGRSTDADGERERARTSHKHSLHRRLDKPSFIDGTGPIRCFATRSDPCHAGRRMPHLFLNSYRLAAFAAAIRFRQRRDQFGDVVG